MDLLLNDASLQGEPLAVIAQAVRSRRNLVTEMVAELRAVKPVRPPLADLRKPVPVHYSF